MKQLTIKNYVSIYSGNKIIKLYTKLLVFTTINLFILLYQNNVVMNNMTSSKNLLMYLTTLFLNCNPWFILCQTYDGTSFRPDIWCAKVHLDFYTLANNAVNFIVISYSPSPFPIKAINFSLFITVITLHIKCISSRIIVYKSQLEMWCK